MESQCQGNVCLLLWLCGPMHPCPHQSFLAISERVSFTETAELALLFNLGCRSDFGLKAMSALTPVR